MPSKVTQKQIDYIKKLYEEIGQEPEYDIENIESWEASEVIAQLLKEKEKLDPPDDGKYWY